MKRSNQVSIGVLLLLAGALLGMQLQRSFDDETREALQKLVEAFKLIDERYVEEVDPDDLAEGALEGMLENLDPHSAYIDAASMKRVEEDFQGSFEGIGISFEFIQGEDGKDSLTVLSVIPGGASDEVGLMAGDRIIEVDGESTLGFETIDVQRTLKGPKGTRVTIKVVRPGYPEVIPFTITRAKIPLYSVDSAYMIDDQTGFIKVSRFARTTYDEFRNAARDLQRQGMERLMLDLRGNQGGYMDIAVQMADEFLSDDALIVSQKGRNSGMREEYRGRPGGTLEELPVIVLVNEGSASASEIVAGALQDHDRGLIVGRQTFGKGLVQQQYMLPDGSALRVTVSHFYTPSGRLIQTPYDGGSRVDYLRDKAEMHNELGLLSAEEIIDHFPDSLKYFTTGGRTVIGGGGIFPDHIIPPDSASALVMEVYRRNVANSFARILYDRHNGSLRQKYGEDQFHFVEDFTIDVSTFEDFLTYAASRGVPLEGYENGAEEGFSSSDVARDRTYLEARIKARLAVRLFGLESYYPVMHPEDVTFQEALALWRYAEELAE